MEKAIDDVVQQAQSLIAVRCQEPLNLPALAAELEARLREHERGALHVAQWLRSQPAVARVLHPDAFK